MKLILFLVSLAFSMLAGAVDLPRVAVVPDSPEPSVAAFADLLSVSLAKCSDQYTLVERAEITKLAAEAEIQKLAADQRPAALAKLAKADGLIIVGADKGDPKSPKLTLRLTSTNNGLVLRSLILGGKEDELPKAAELAAGVLRFPCERLAHGDAKPPVIVSLLGLRPAFEIDRALETTLNLAVAQQLSAQSGIAVSERWKMNDLVFERSLVDEKPQSFATGTVLLDGSYIRKGDQLEFSLRLRKAESEAGKNLTLQGPANKPTDLAQQIAKLVATESGQSGQAVAWNALEEAKQYADLGWWLFQRKLSEESARAYEVAMALGLIDEAVLRGRVLAYQQTVDHKDVFYSNYYSPEVDGWELLSKAEFKQKLMTAIRMSQVAIEGMEVRWGGITQKELMTDEHAHLLRRSFDESMKVLQVLCLRKEQLEFASEARTLRALSRSLVAKGEAETRRVFTSQIKRFFYMYETPDDAAADLRHRLLPEFMNGDGQCDGASLRRLLWGTCRDPGLWRFVDWETTDNQRGMAAWKRFIEELQSSKDLLERSDGLAFAFQCSLDPKIQEEILASYCTLLESHMDELLTPQGQMTFWAFYYYYYDQRNNKSKQYPAYEVRMNHILARTIESGAWLELSTCDMMVWAVRNWCAERGNGRTVIPEAEANHMLVLIEKYIDRGKSDPRWEKQFVGFHGKYFHTLPELIILAYPNIKARRLEVRPAMAGAVPIQVWKPQAPSASNMKLAMNDYAIVTYGDFLLLPSYGHGIVELNVRSMTVSRIIGLPLLKKPYVSNFAKNDTSLMVEMNHRLFVTPLSSAGKSWVEVVIPDVKPEDQLSWHIQGNGPDFFVGSYFVGASIPGTKRVPPRMLAGTVRDGKLTWQVSSNRRPALNPIDTMAPRSTMLAYQNAAGRTMMLLGEWHGERFPLVELETGREVSQFPSNINTQGQGEMPLYWDFEDNRILFLAGLDSAREQPRMLFRSPKWRDQPEIWKNVSPVYESNRPEFRSNCIAPIVHGGYLWLLKREPDVPGKYEKNDPRAFRLVRMGLDGGESITIPLGYDVSAAVRGVAKDDRADLEKPVVNMCSLCTTPKGLFFAPCGYENLFISFGRPMSGQPTPALLYITWDDINAWLAKNAPESSKPASP